MAALDLVSEGRLTNLGTIIAAGSQGKAVLRGGGVVFDGASGSGSTLTEGGGTDAQIRVSNIFSGVMVIGRSASHASK